MHSPALLHVSAAALGFSMTLAALAPSPAVASRQEQSEPAAAPAASVAGPSQLELLRSQGNEALYNMDYQSARARYLQMTTLAPDYPAGFVYLANTLWLETLYAARRLSTSLYNGPSFYEQDAAEDKVDPKRDRQFQDLIKQALALAKARLQKNPQDVEALYYEASALGVRASYSTTVKRSFTRAIGDANESIQLQKKVVKLDPAYIDAYLSIGLYEYVVDSLPLFWRSLARLAGLKGSKKKGIEHLELAARQGKYVSDDAQVVLIGLYSREGEPERALDIISKLAAKYPRNYLFGVERGAALFRLGRADDGSRVFEDLLKDEQIRASVADIVNFQWGEGLAAKGDYAAALIRFSEVIKCPKSPAGLSSMAHLRAGQALDALGRRAEAAAEYQIVLRRDNVFDSHKQAAQFIKRPYVPAKA